MNSDDFEQRLQRQPLRSLPSEWRAEILRKAQQAVPLDTSNLCPLPSPWWREWLWPCPQAWAGLAAAWMIIVGLHLSTPDAASASAVRVQTSPVQLRQAIQEKLQLLAELNPPGEASFAEPPKPYRPKPRSERRPAAIAC